MPVCLLCLCCLLWQTLLPTFAQTYDNVGNLKSVSRGNGIVTSYGYDELNRLSDMVNAKGASEVSRFHYPVRADGKRTGLTERLVNADLVNNAPRVSNRSVSFGYDNAGRLTGEAGDDGLGVAYQTSYTYDKVGNRTGTLYKRATTAAPNTFSRTTTVASTFNANDWLTGQSIQNDGGAVQTQSYTYDRSGSQLTEQNGSNTPQENDWGFDGKLQGTKAQGQSTGGTTYTTDAAGSRIGVTLNTGLAQQKTTRYLVDENTSYAGVLEERAPDTNDTAAQELQARYVWGQGLAPVAMWRKGSDGTVKLFFMLTDGQDSVRQLTNSSGSVTDSYFYDAWGNGLGGGSGTTVNPFRYTGQQLDPSGKYFLRARYYDPGNGRFLSHDPLTGSDSDPITMHRYLYAINDAINLVDPSGLRPYTQSEGYSVERAIDPLYAADHPGDTITFGAIQYYDANGWVGFRRGVTPGTLRFRKPDIFNSSNLTYMEIKPFSSSGIPAGAYAMARNFLAYGPKLGAGTNPFGAFVPDIVWQPPTPAILADNGTTYWVVNAGGVLFYTDLASEGRLLVAESLIGLALDRATLRGLLQATEQGVGNALGRIPGLIGTRTIADQGRFDGQLGIAGTLAVGGVL